MQQQSPPQGAQGFAIPLAAGNYSFIIQQTGLALTSYQFDFVVTPVPEPRSMLRLRGRCCRLRSLAATTHLRVTDN
ncbi:MAG: hypothetical protein ACJ8C4_13980 [Gemmataceae bacterium]